MKKILIVIIVILAVVFFLAQGQDTESENIRIGWIGPQTGQSAVLGMDSATAAQMAVDEINENGGIDGKMIELFIEDDQYITPKTVSAYRKLVEVHDVEIIMINTYSGLQTLAERAHQDDVVLIDPLDCNTIIEQLGENIFCLATDTESIAQVLYDYANEQEYKRAGVIYFNSDTFMPYVKDVFIEGFEGEVFAHGHTADVNDFRTVLTSLKDQDIDTLVFLGYDETGLAMKQARELGIEVQFLVTGTVTSPSLQEAAEGTVEGAMIAFWEAPGDEVALEFKRKFEDIAGRPPILDLATYPTYDTVYAISEGYKNNPNDIREGLLEVQGLRGTTGDISFSPVGSVRIIESLFEFKDGQVIAVE